MVEKNSENFKKVKKLYFVDKLKIKKVSIRFDNNEGIPNIKGDIIFDKKGQDIRISGNERDFISLAFDLQPIIKDGRTEIIDLNSLPVKNIKNYYKNVDLFLSKEKDPIKKSIEMIMSNESGLPQGMDIKKGLICILKKNFDDDNAKGILNNYYDSIALLVLQLEPIHKVIEEAKKRQIKDMKRYDEYSRLCDDVFKEKIRKQPPLKSFIDYEDKCMTDLKFSLENLLREIKDQDLRWKSLHVTTGGKLDGKEGIPKIVDEYSNLFEIIKDILKDLANLLKEANDETNLDSSEKIIKFLKDNGYNKLIESIEPKLRNGGTHFSVDYSDKGFVKIYNNSGKKRRVEKTFTYNDVLEKHKSIRDLSFALLFTYLLNDYIILIKTMDSPDFKFFVITNKPT